VGQRAAPAGAQLAVVGSINVDAILRVPRLPRPGETVMGADPVRTLGGKAANQSVAAARTGIRVTLIGAVGDDADGSWLVGQLREAGVDTTAVLRLTDSPCGSAIVLVDAGGDNAIVVSPGANGHLAVDDVRRSAEAIGRANALVAQGESPVPATTEALRIADRAGVRCIVNLAPIVDLGPDLCLADPLIVNRLEASELLGRDVDGADHRTASDLLRFARSAVVTLGPQGALLTSADGSVRHVPTPKAAAVVDTTGAGDAFVGVLAAGLAASLPLDRAAEAAVSAATASVSVLGAGVNYPGFTIGPGLEPHPDIESKIGSWST
jgi:ribokinase